LANAHNALNTLENRNAASAQANIRAATNRYYRVELSIRGLPRPLSKNAALRLKHARNAMNRAVAAEAARVQNARNRLNAVQAEVNRAFGQRVTPNQARTLLLLADSRARRTVARALNSNAVVNRAMRKRRARNMIGMELEIHGNSGSPLRPSSVARSVRRR
jgi:hypothetical protein